MVVISVGAWVLCQLPTIAQAADANRLTYLDDSDPYYVSRSFPKLITPQWVGEKGVDAVVIIAIDDMRDPARYEKVLSPTIDRLKQIDGRAPISIMTCKVNPADPQLKTFLDEGISLEVHTIDHPCPILAGGNFAKARKTFDDCVDLMDAIPGNHAVAFRTPCCDSKNTLSPRLLAEIFNRTTQHGNFLEADSSVFHRFSWEDPSLPRELVLNDQSEDRYAKYVPFANFANAIRNYPYPFVIGKLCWEFPCITPSDWESHNIQGDGNPQLRKDWEAQLDATVIKQGVFTLVFHPYGWSKPEQMAQFVDYIDKKYGRRVRFLTFRDAVERINKNLLDGQSLRDEKGGDNGVRLIDLNGDGYLDVVVGNSQARLTRIWDAKAGKWIDGSFPAQIASRDSTGRSDDAGARFGVIRPNGAASVLVSNESTRGAWSFVRDQWIKDPDLRAALDLDGGILAARHGIDQGVRLRDIDNDGQCELIVSNPNRQSIYRFEQGSWKKLPFDLPAGTSIVDGQGRDAGLRFVDIDEDGFEDVIFSNEQQYALYLWGSIKDGWSRKVTSGKRTPGDRSQIPAIVRNGTNNGAWFMNRAMWVQNEDTDTLPDVVEHKTFAELLGTTEPGPRDTVAAIKSIKTRAGFQVELAAAEPLTEDPIAFAWGPDGRLWVVEMGDYPLGIDGKGKPGGVIRILEDTNGDGHYTKSTVFLDHIPFPTGIMPWGKGVLITDAPEIFYAEDTKRDGHCDYRKTLYRGFNEGNQQHRVNGLQWGLDNWIHGANGNSGGNIVSFKGGKPLSISGRDFRIQPDEGLIETETGQSQYGHTMNNWGDWFGCDNTNPMYQYVLVDHYLARNKYLTPPDPRSQVSDTPGASAVYPISRTLPRFNDPWGADHFTSANSAIIYRDDLFGPPYIGNSFVSEPVHDLVHREIMRKEGVLYHSHRAEDEQQSEFFASSDNWCRPTMLRVGPDGALWIADMYRYVIEHPEWIPKDWQARLDLRAGHDKGRIYRVFPSGVKPRPIPRLDRLSLAELVAALDSPSGWQRDMVQQMLVRKQDRAAIPLLAKLARESKNPLARLHALCTLDGLDGLDGNLLLAGLKDSEAGVRRNAIRLCEGRFEKFPHIGARLAEMVDDSDPQVRLQLAYTLGEWNDPRAGDALAKLAVRVTGDRYLSAAILSSISKQNIQTVAKAFTSSEKQGGPTFGNSLLRLALLMGDQNATAMLVGSAIRPGEGQNPVEQFSKVADVLDVLESGNSSLAQLSRGEGEDVADAIQRVNAAIDSARAIAKDSSHAEAERAAALRLLGRQENHLSDDLQLLSSFLTPQTSESLQQAAVASLAKVHKAQAIPVLLAAWKEYLPSRRAQVLDALLSRRDGLAALLDAIDAKKVLPNELDAPHRQRMLQTRDASMRSRARKLLAETIKPDRQQVIDSFKSVLTLNGDATRGSQVFGKTCVPCHRLGGQGNAVGPDLAGVGDKSVEGLMISILDPNRAVEPQFVNYVAETKDGQTYSGILRRESGSSVTMAMPGNIEQTILRSELKLLRSTGLSLMPDGLEAGMSPQNLADLIAFVRAAGPPAQRRSLAGNNPQVVVPTSDGKLQLLPETCEIFGSKLTLERQYGNLGWWTADDDHAIWSMQPARAGMYDVYIQYACDNTSAGNTLVLQCGTERIAFKVESTGNWDTYRKVHVGQMKLSAGRQHLTARGQPPIVGALIDLRAIELLPAKQ